MIDVIAVIDNRRENDEKNVSEKISVKIRAKKYRFF